MKGHIRTITYNDTFRFAFGLQFYPYGNILENSDTLTDV